MDLNVYDVYETSIETFNWNHLRYLFRILLNTLTKNLPWERKNQNRLRVSVLLGWWVYVNLFCTSPWSTLWESKWSCSLQNFNLSRFNLWSFCQNFLDTLKVDVFGEVSSDLFQLSYFGESKSPRMWPVLVL